MRSRILRFDIVIYPVSLDVHIYLSYPH